MPPPEPSAVTIGNFDGVHRGHQVLLAATCAAARRAALCPTVLTFEPHPAELIAPHRAPPRICPPAEKLRLLAARGIAQVLAQRFEADFAALTPDAFIEQVLCQALGARHVVVGHDFCFGRRRAGTARSLQAAGAALGFEVQIIAPQAVDGQIASSTAIREAVLTGEVAAAARLLGRCFSVVGEVVTGDRRGRRLGFPTANVASAWPLRPAHGVYAGWLDAGAGPAAAVINVGRQPTFGADRSPMIEAHVLDQTGLDLYGREVRVWFATRLRAEQRFAGSAALIAQIDRDLARAREQLRALPPPTASPPTAPPPTAPPPTEPTPR